MTKTTKQRLEVAVQKGVALLDEKRPTWRAEVRRRLESHDLVMSECARCVLGHLFTYYDRGLVYLDLDEVEEKIHGFNVPNLPLGTDLNEQYEELEVLWLKEIMQEDPDAPRLA